MNVILSLIPILLAIGGFLVLLDRHDRRAHQERAAAAAERQVLLQRIQAPAEAVFEHATREAPFVPPSAPQFDDDEAYWKQRADVTKEQLAEALLEHETGQAS